MRRGREEGGRIGKRWVVEGKNNEHDFKILISIRIQEYLFHQDILVIWLHYHNPFRADSKEFGGDVEFKLKSTTRSKRP